MKNTLNKNIKAIIIGILAVFGASYVSADWVSAPANPPSNNTAAPINVSSTHQFKYGSLSINTTTSSPDQYGLDVYGISRFFGNLEIGTVATPATLKIIDGNQASGRVLTSDANGFATWKTVASSTGPTGSSNVNKIIAGTNITISPTTGKGDVTINASGSLTPAYRVNADSATTYVKLDNSKMTKCTTAYGCMVSIGYFDSSGISLGGPYKFVMSGNRNSISRQDQANNYRGTLDHNNLQINQGEAPFVSLLGTCYFSDADSMSFMDDADGLSLINYQGTGTCFLIIE